MKFERVPAGERAFPAGPDSLGLRSKLGGKPEWDQNDETPECPGCGEPMTFVGQIDSIEHNADHNPNQMDCGKQHYMFGDVGIIYVFICFECLETQSVFQCG